MLYRSNDPLDVAHAKMFTEKSKTHDELNHIDRYPPTEGAATFHIKRLFHQVCTWYGRDLDPLEWGFFLKDGKLLPVMTKLPVAPDLVLSKIKCSCRSTCTKRCSCRNFSLDCTNNCRNCIHSCLNKPEVDDEDPYLEEMLVSIQSIF